MRSPNLAMVAAPRGRTRVNFLFSDFAAVRWSQMAQSRHLPRRCILVAFGPKRTLDGIWPVTVCPLLTRSRHWLCSAAMVLMPVSASIEVLH